MTDQEIQDDMRAQAKAVKLSPKLRAALATVDSQQQELGYAPGPEDLDDLGVSPQTRGALRKRDLIERTYHGGWTLTALGGWVVSLPATTPGDLTA